MNGLKIIVCAKQVPNPEAPASAVEVNQEQMLIKVRGLPPEINPLDETALEAALQLKEKYGGKITVVSVGGDLSEHVLRKTLAAGADELILVKDVKFDSLDSYSTAFVLYKTIEKIGDYDLILTGMEASDWNSGQVGLILSELLKIPAINWVKKIELIDGEVHATKLFPGGYEVVKAPLPLLMTITSEYGEPRYVSLAALKRAREKTVKVWKIEDIGIDSSILKERRIIELSKIKLERRCTFVNGTTPEEIGKNLAIKLRETLRLYK